TRREPERESGKHSRLSELHHRVQVANCVDSRWASGHALTAATRRRNEWHVDQAVHAPPYPEPGFCWLATIRRSSCSPAGERPETTRASTASRSASASRTRRIRRAASPGSSATGV